jgi:hypothetical protein
VGTTRNRWEGLPVIRLLVPWAAKKAAKASKATCTKLLTESTFNGMPVRALNEIAPKITTRARTKRLPPSVPAFVSHFTNSDAPGEINLICSQRQSEAPM